jgi:hypothetical protein
MFDRDFDPIPNGLDEMAPGPVLAALLASIDVDRVSAHDRVVVLRATQRLASHTQAGVYAAMASIADAMDRDLFADDPELAWEAAATEIRVGLRLTRRCAESDLGLALDLRLRLPSVLEALRDGRIDGRRARVIASGTSGLDEAVARLVADEVMDDAAGLTTGQLANRIRRLGIEVDPEGARRRYEEGVAARRVVLEAGVDGTANLLGLDLPPDRASAAARNIDRVASALNRHGDARSLDQIRADVLVDLLCGSGTGRVEPRGGGSVDLRVDLATLAGLAESPGDLDGFGPVIADIARQVAAAQTGGQWRFTITDPTTGLPVHDGTTRRRPSAAQRRSVTARDVTCIFPGCRMPASACDLDHRVPWSQRQRTDTAGLNAVCRYDHVTVRHRIGWKHRALPGGDHLWISPLGHRYTTSGRSP